VGAPFGEILQVGLDGVGDQAGAVLARVGARRHDDMHVKVHMLVLQPLEPREAREDRRKAGATACSACSRSEPGRTRTRSRG